MAKRRSIIKLFTAIVSCVGGLCSPVIGHAADLDPGAVRIISPIEGTVEVRPAGATDWVVTQTNTVLRPGGRLRTGPRARATLLWWDESVLTLGPLSEIEILPQKQKQGGLNLLQGLMSFFHRDEPGRIQVITKGAHASVEGTEFVIRAGLASEPEASLVSVIDGVVRLSNEHGTLTLTNNQEARVEAGTKPVRTAGFLANNVLQWALYYPAVLDLDDLPLAPDVSATLADSLQAYRKGDLLAALALYPGERVAASDAERVYHAALLLSVGEVARAEAMLSQIATTVSTSRERRLAAALETLVAAVKFQPAPVGVTPELATECLAASYYAQSRANGDEALKRALRLARESASRSEGFGFAYARVAELELCFDRREHAREALLWARSFTPRNPQALAVEGFLLVSENRVHSAIDCFNQALALDATLANAWLGRGLARIRSGDSQGGREDLLIAAALEPQRAVLRSYLAKAYADAGEKSKAAHEMGLARELDRNDPTAWLYSALIYQQENRINEAIRDLEQSVALNDNRRLYRSELLLDQDRAVRGANLASVYRDAGMDDVSVREATRAVNYDYANYSAHLFLANSYNQLRDPQQINLRYETPWLSEYLMANLLAPVGAGTLSQTVSQQEYSKLFERDRFGVASSTEYLSRGDWLQSASLFGNDGNFGYAVDTHYRSENGQRPNNDQEQLTVSVQLKYDVTPSDSVFFQSIYYDAKAGDLAQYYDPASARLDLRIEESQEPLLLAGYRHEWSPGVQTLFAAGRFDDEYGVTATRQPVLLLAKDGAGQVYAVPTPMLPTAPLDYQSRLEMYSAELQQILQKEEHTVVFGARYQTAKFDTDSDLSAATPTRLASLTATSIVSFASAPFSQSVESDLERVSGYGYWYWQVVDPLQLCAGLSYDYLSYPENHRYPPVSGTENDQHQLSPKAGVTWRPWHDSIARFAYTRSLGGVSFDQSVRLEPTQVAGFNQAFRSLMPESIVGSVAGAEFETFGLALEQKLKAGTYIGIEGQLLNSEADRTIGAVDLLFPPTYVASSTRQNLDYQEQNLIVTLNQLMGEEWSFGARYQLAFSELETVYPDIPDSVTSANHTKDNALLHQLSLFGLFNHRSGFFARAEGHWYSQDNGGDQAALADDAFWQVNLFAGYRFWRRHAQISVGVLNLGDQDYRLSPLNAYRELPRERTFVTSLQFNF